MTSIRRLARVDDDDDNVGCPPSSSDRPEGENFPTLTVISPSRNAEIELISAAVLDRIEPIIRRILSSPSLNAEIELIIADDRNRIETEIGHIIRRIVRIARDELNSLLMGIQLRIPANLMHPSYCRALQLRFMNKIAKQSFTGSIVKGENGTCIEVALFDESTEEIVKSGPGASARIRILMIDSDYKGEEDLNEKINEANRRTESIFKGNAVVSLKEGIGYINELSFAHRRDWLKKSNCVLVAMLVDSIDRVRVKAAVSEPFTIKDSRSKLYSKKEIPSLDDAIWRLKNIRRRSPVYKCLEECKIVTVLTFLREFNVNPERLRQIVGAHMSDNEFKATISHAKKCVFNREELYECNKVVFNVVGEIKGGYCGHYFVEFDELIDQNKDFAKSVMSSVFQHGKYSPHVLPRVAQKRWKLIKLFYSILLFLRRNIVSRTLNNNNAHKRLKIC